MSVERRFFSKINSDFKFECQAAYKDLIFSLLYFMEKIVPLTHLNEVFREINRTLKFSSSFHLCSHAVVQMHIISTS